MKISNKGNHLGFSLIEIIFSILIISIVATIALPKFFQTTKSSSFIRLASDISAIRNGIKSYSDKVEMMNSNPALLELDDGGIYLFSKILQTPIKVETSYPFWSKKSNNVYLFNFDETTNLEFVYDSQNLTFLCDSTNSLCDEVGI